MAIAVQTLHETRGVKTMNVRFLAVLFVSMLFAICACSIIPNETSKEIGAGEIPDPLTEAVILVSRMTAEFPWDKKVLLIKPIEEEMHGGFILNLPHPNVTLASIYPEHGPSQKVHDPIYMGGYTVDRQRLFVLVQTKDTPSRDSAKFSRDIFAVEKREVIDRIIEKEADRAKYLNGLVIWRPGQLEQEIKNGIWYIFPVTKDIVFRKSTNSLWEELVVKGNLRDNGI